MGLEYPITLRFIVVPLSVNLCGSVTVVFQNLRFFRSVNAERQYSLASATVNWFNGAWTCVTDPDFAGSGTTYQWHDVSSLYRGGLDVRSTSYRTPPVAYGLAYGPVVLTTASVNRT